MKNQYYIEPFQKDCISDYIKGWRLSIEYIDKYGYKVAKNYLNTLMDNQKDIKGFHHANGYFCYICQYASDNNII